MAERVAEHVTIEQDGAWFLNDPVFAMYHDLDPADQEGQKSLAVVHNVACSYSETVYEAWGDIPSTYVRTTGDRCVPPPYQDLCVVNVVDAGVPLDVVVFDCGHSACAKYPKEVAELVIKASKSI
ncbi:hypothetical protein F4804DRAFT_321394 [Jackrogersella minutella]|nr:hypothetical protein F4804DRAFT_321394 [Jackrogersella minutella]